MMKSKTGFRRYRRVALMLCACMMLSSLMACGDEPGPSSKLKIDVYGWGPSENGDGFVQGMPLFTAANTIRLKVTQPHDGRILATESFMVDNHTGKLPSITFGENLRVDLEVLDTTLTVVASGSTPVFTFDPDTRQQSFRIMVAPTHKAAPVGSLVADRVTGANKLVQSRIDYSGASLEGDRNWLGRIGHGMAVASNGHVLIVGGGDARGAFKPAVKPDFHHVFSDVQLFDPLTGYFTDLSFDDEARALQNTGKDRLRTGRAFHTVTPLGKDRFLVSGGYTIRAGSVRAVNSLEVIDLRAPVGMRIQELPNSAQMSEARAFHTATHRASDGAVVIAGGVGHQGVEDVYLDSIDVIDVVNGRVETLKMKSVRADHSAALAPDGHTIWLLGGRDGDTVLATTERVVTDEATGVTKTESAAKMKTARFGAAAVRLSGSGGNLVAMIGGFSSTAGNAIDDYEIGGFYRDEFATDGLWKLKTPRGGMQAIELPQTNDIMLLGGLTSGQLVPTSERLRYRGLEDPVPLAAEAQGGFQKARHGFGATLINNGFVFVVGGQEPAENTALDNAEYFNALDPVKNKAK